MIHHFHVSLLCLTLAFGLHGETASVQAQAPDAKPAATPTADAKPAAEEDRSLTVAEAEAMKFPPLDRPWMGKDYLAAAEILSRLNTLDGARLPRSGSARSGELFAKLTTTGHFASFNDPAVEVKKRVPEALEQFQTLGQLAKIYDSAAGRKLIGPTEGLELFGTQLHAARRVLMGLDEYVASLDEEKDKNIPFRKEGIDKLKEAVADMVATAIAVIGNDKLPTEDRSRLIAAAQAALPEVISKLPDPTRQPMLLRLKFIATNTEAPELQAELRKLADEVSKAAAPAP